MIFLSLLAWRVIRVVSSGGCIEDAYNMSSLLTRLSPESRKIALGKDIETVCEGDLGKFRRHSRSIPIDTAKSQLEFKPINLNETLFAKLKSLGGMSESSFGKRSIFYRFFEDQRGRKITLFEQDMSVNGLQAHRLPQYEPYRVHGLPARFVIFKASSGEAVSFLDWVDRNKIYQIWVDEVSLHEETRSYIFLLAESLPTASDNR